MSKRTKEWWARLSSHERSELFMLERSGNYRRHGGGYLADNCGYCDYCGEPMVGSGLCGDCARRIDYLINKANGQN